MLLYSNTYSQKQALGLFCWIDNLLTDTQFEGHGPHTHTLQLHPSVDSGPANNLHINMLSTEFLTSHCVISGNYWI